MLVQFDARPSALDPFFWPAGSGINRLVFSGVRGLERSQHVLARTGALVNETAGAEFFQCRPVQAVALALHIGSKRTAAIRSLLPAKAEPAKAEPAPAAPATSGPEYVIQVGAFAKPESVIAKLAAAKLPYFTEPLQGNLTRVRAGPFASKEAADQALVKLKELGLKPGAVTTKSG